MKAAGMRFGFLGLAVAALLLSTAGCTAPSMGPGASRPDQAHNARNSLDWAGTYRGVLPCADCEGIETVVILSTDGRYRTQSRYLGKDDEARTAQGDFSWNEAGNTITFEGRDAASHFVAENRLIRLAPDGSRITGEQAERYVLMRLSDGVMGKY